jgi:hypothetical protein
VPMLTRSLRVGLMVLERCNRLSGKDRFAGLRVELYCSILVRRLQKACHTSRKQLQAGLPCTQNESLNTGQERNHRSSQNSNMELYNMCLPEDVLRRGHVELASPGLRKSYS